MNNYYAQNRVYYINAFFTVLIFAGFFIFFYKTMIINARSKIWCVIFAKTSPVQKISSSIVLNILSVLYI